MNYRHAFHAGNFADVAKHLALISVLLHMRKKDAPFAVVDTHAGRGVYDLTTGEAARTGEAEGGIARLAGLQGGPSALSTYLDLTRARDAYPGSPLIAAKLLRPQDRLVAVEKHPEDAAALAATLRPFRKARAEAADGYSRLIALLPPPERRAAILIDPPYEADGEFSEAAGTVAGAIRRFATGIYLVWFPVKSLAGANGFCGEVLAAGARKVLRLDVTLGARSEERLTTAGLLIVNPPFGFETEMREALALVLPRLDDARANFTWLSGSE
jgi:23S rRNA (adenine2030-N6)-methyltransferase